MQSAFGGDRQTVFRGLAVYHEPRANRMLVGGLAPIESRSSPTEIAADLNALCAQFLGCHDLRGDDPFASHDPRPKMQYRLPRKR